MLNIAQEKSYLYKKIKLILLHDTQKILMHSYWKETLS
jgi:hypothetical protein